MFDTEQNKRRPQDIKKLHREKAVPQPDAPTGRRRSRSIMTYKH